MRPCDSHSYWQTILTTLLWRPADQKAAATAQVLQQQEALLTGLLLLAQSVCQSTAGAQLLLRWGLMSQLSELARWLLERVLDAGDRLHPNGPMSNTLLPRSMEVQDSCAAVLCVQQVSVTSCGLAQGRHGRSLNPANLARLPARCCLLSAVLFDYRDHLAYGDTGLLERPTPERACMHDRLVPAMMSCCATSSGHVKHTHLSLTGLQMPLSSRLHITSIPWGCWGSVLGPGLQQVAVVTQTGRPHALMAAMAACWRLTSSGVHC